jgi:hypothetical protein
MAQHGETAPGSHAGRRWKAFQRDTGFHHALNEVWSIVQPRVREVVEGLLRTQAAQTDRVVDESQISERVGFAEGKLNRPITGAV